MSDYPVQVDIASPAHFDRLQVLIRVGIAAVLVWIGITAGWLVVVLFIALPVLAAYVISSEGPDEYITSFAPALWRVLAWMLRLSAYMLMLVDRVPTFGERAAAPLIRFTGHPTVGTALGRLVTSLPSGALLVLLWCGSNVVVVVAAVLVLLGLAIPTPLLAFQRGVLRWQARLVAYHASLVTDYPPWVLDIDGSIAAPAIKYVESHLFAE